MPYAFTEQGIYMLATVLRGELAEQQSIFIMRTFREMCHYIKVNYLIRNKTIDKLAYDGSRDIRVQIGSIGVNPDMTVEGDRQA